MSVAKDVVAVVVVVLVVVPVVVVPVVVLVEVLVVVVVDDVPVLATMVESVDEVALDISARLSLRHEPANKPPSTIKRHPNLQIPFFTLVPFSNSSTQVGADWLVAEEKKVDGKQLQFRITSHFVENLAAFAHSKRPLKRLQLDSSQNKSTISLGVSQLKVQIDFNDKSKVVPLYVKDDAVVFKYAC